MNNLKIDIISDLHFDAHFNELFDNPVDLKIAYNFYDSYFLNREADTLIIAGDIGHINRQNINLLKMFRQRYYEHIVMVAGNHDYLLYDKRGDGKVYKDSFERINDFKVKINEIDGLYFLDGNVININGIRIGGSMGWYDGKYTLKHFTPFHPLSLQVLWSETMPDSRAIIPMNRFDDLFYIEYEKMNKASLACDIMVTHINPSIEKEHTYPQYRDNKGTAFYTFDGDELLKQTSAKFWIFGHTHMSHEYCVHDVNVLCNPFGYPQKGEIFKHVKIRSISLNVDK